jgi:hypothetical protein
MWITLLLVLLNSLKIIAWLPTQRQLSSVACRRWVAEDSDSEAFTESATRGSGAAAAAGADAQAAALRDQARRLRAEASALDRQLDMVGGRRLPATAAAPLIPAPVVWTMLAGSAWRVRLRLTGFADAAADAGTVTGATGTSSGSPRPVTLEARVQLLPPQPDSKGRCPVRVFGAADPAVAAAGSATSADPRLPRGYVWALEKGSDSEPNDAATYLRFNLQATGLAPLVPDGSLYLNARVVKVGVWVAPIHTSHGRMLPPRWRPSLIAFARVLRSASGPADGGPAARRRGGDVQASAAAGALPLRHGRQPPRRVPRRRRGYFQPRRCPRRRSCLRLAPCPCPAAGVMPSSMRSVDAHSGLLAAY